MRNDVVSHATVALVGMGGAGKTILATAIARDPAVQAAFPDGIAWVEAGQQATPTLLQERLAARLTGEAVSFPAAEVGRHRLAELLAGRAFLLVIDDVWDAEALNALNVVGAPRGALLFTTRDRSIARAVGATAREVDELTLEQALALLGRWTETDFDQLPPVADALCLRVGNLALGVALVGGMVKGRGAQPRDWQEVMGLLDRADIDAIADAYAPDSYKHASVLASITLSIDDLPAADRDRYRELAVFAGRGSVPPAAVSALWASAGYSADDTARLLARLTDRSLAQRDDAGVDQTPRPPIRRRRPPAHSQPRWPRASPRPPPRRLPLPVPSGGGCPQRQRPRRPFGMGEGPGRRLLVSEPRLPPRSRRPRPAARPAPRELRVAGTQARSRRHQRPARRLLASTTPPTGTSTRSTAHCNSPPTSSPATQTSSLAS